MNFSSLNFKSFWKRRPAARGVFHKSRLFPIERDWLIILILCGTVAVCLGTISLRLFYVVQDTAVGLPSPSAQSGPQTIDRAKFEEALLQYRERAVDFDALAEGSLGLPNPSR